MPLEDVAAHFERLNRQGGAFQRLIITWEALEHEGPGIYDEAYLAYLRKILLIAAEKGIAVLIEPRLDKWSRWTGGEGAPAWTLEKVGIAIESRAEAARLQDTAAAMYTLFFAGNTYAPDIRIDGERAQDWLQERYLACMRHCFRRLKNCKAVAGWAIQTLLGAWGSESSSAALLLPGDTLAHTGITVEKAKFADEFFTPFMARFTERLREVNPGAFFGELPLTGSR
jgi:hypothetical protein